MHQAFARTSFRIAVIKVPASGLERRSPSATRVVIIVGSGAVAGGTGILLAFCVFLVADHTHCSESDMDSSYVVYPICEHRLQKCWRVPSNR